MNREWEKELMRARRKNCKPHLRNALFHQFWPSCIVDGFLVFTFTMLKSIMPVFLAQLLLQFQLPSNASSASSSLHQRDNNNDNNETSTATIVDELANDITTIPTIISNSNHTNVDGDDDLGNVIFQYMLFIW
jgi:hypothetical protein